MIELMHDRDRIIENPALADFSLPACLDQRIMSRRVAWSGVEVDLGTARINPYTDYNRSHCLIL